jgi:hypothetical protein
MLPRPPPPHHPLLAYLQQLQEERKNQLMRVQPRLKRTDTKTRKSHQSEDKKCTTIHNSRTARLRMSRELQTRKQKELRYEKLNPDAYAKRIACRVAATAAIQSNSVGPASRTPRADACRLLEYTRMAIACAQGTNARQRFRQALSRNSPAPHLTLSPKPIAMSEQIHTYTELQQQIHHDLRIQHPEWVEPTGDCPTCDEHEARLKRLLEGLARSESNESPLLSAEIGDADRQMASTVSDKSRGPSRAHNNPP